MFEDTSRRRSVFRSESALNPDATADTAVGRDTELDRIEDAIKPLTSGSAPEDLLLVGPPGVGKTTCVNHVLAELEEHTRVKGVYINCWQHNTRPALLAHLLIELGYMVPRKGRAVDSLLSRLQEWLDKNRSVVVVLDEFDQLGDAADVIYDLKQISSETEHELGVVMICNESQPEESLDGRCWSRLDYTTVEFEGYDADTLFSILRERADQAFRPNTVSDHVLQIIADMVADKDGDCRQALALLRQAGREADRANADEVTAAHVQQRESPSAGPTPV
ncbi:MAG: AAA family ATPase [Candidatus Nanohaloarchaea archaeon]|nr:AAA family ATPase [Candidatus Nanohaloarchaea archaeon]